MKALTVEVLTFDVRLHVEGVTLRVLENGRPVHRLLCHIIALTCSRSKNARAPNAVTRLTVCKQHRDAGIVIILIGRRNTVKNVDSLLQALAGLRAAVAARRQAADNLRQSAVDRIVRRDGNKRAARRLCTAVDGNVRCIRHNCHTAVGGALLNRCKESIHGCLQCRDALLAVVVTAGQGEIHAA